MKKLMTMVMVAMMSLTMMAQEDIYVMDGSYEMLTDNWDTTLFGGEYAPLSMAGNNWRREFGLSGEVTGTQFGVALTKDFDFNSYEKLYFDLDLSYGGGNVTVFDMLRVELRISTDNGNTWTDLVVIDPEIQEVNGTITVETDDYASFHNFNGTTLVEMYFGFVDAWHGKLRVQNFTIRGDVGTASLEDEMMSANDITVSMNKANNTFKVTSSTNEALNVQIFDMSGRTVANGVVDTFNDTVAFDYSTGTVYVVNVTDMNGQVVKSVKMM